MLFGSPNGRHYSASGDPGRPSMNTPWEDRALYPVSTRRLGSIQGFVGRLDNLLYVRFLFSARSDANTYGN